MAASRRWLLAGLVVAVAAGAASLLADNDLNVQFHTFNDSRGVTVVRARRRRGTRRVARHRARAFLRVDRAPVDHGEPPRRSAASSASTPTGSRSAASRCASSTTTAATSVSASRARSSSRGPDLFPGYTDPALTAAAIDADGWYASGDIGVRDVHGAITITDRKKDIIIRGGENISAAEVEELLVRMPGVAEVAVVAAPDERMGEHVCAFLRMLPDAEAPDLELVRGHLERAVSHRQKWPEELRVAEEFPRTASGKVQKYVLRGRVRDAGR